MSSEFLTPLLVILVVAACTFATRFLPFAPLLAEEKKCQLW